MFGATGSRQLASRNASHASRVFLAVFQSCRHHRTYGQTQPVSLASSTTSLTCEFSRQAAWIRTSCSCPAGKKVPRLARSLGQPAYNLEKPPAKAACVREAPPQARDATHMSRKRGSLSAGWRQHLPAQKAAQALEDIGLAAAAFAQIRVDAAVLLVQVVDHGAHVSGVGCQKRGGNLDTRHTRRGE